VELESSFGIVDRHGQCPAVIPVPRGDAEERAMVAGASGVPPCRPVTVSRLRGSDRGRRDLQAVRSRRARSTLIRNYLIKTGANKRDGEMPGMR